MIEVADQTLYQQRGHLDLPDDRVATAAQQAAHSPRRVAVVHDQDDGSMFPLMQPRASVMGDPRDGVEVHS